MLKRSIVVSRRKRRRSEMRVTWLRTVLRGGLAATLLALASPWAAAQETVTVGALQYGTVNWELDTIRHHGFDAAEGIRVEVRPVGSRNAAAVALQSGAVDVIVTDWVWVSRQRGSGRPWTFYPWSMTVGGIMVNPEAGIDSIADLAGQRLGVAGGPVDKSWLILRAWYRQRHGEDLAAVVEPVFGAPPLLNEFMLGGDLPAVINYWHYSARLDAAGMEPLVEVQALLPELGIHEPVPLLGWVFSEDWAQRNPETLRAFLRASDAAKALLAESTAEWERLRPLTKAEDDATLEALREGFRAGIPGPFTRAQAEAARALYAILAREGGADLTGGQEALTPGTFWLPSGEQSHWQQ
jgi:NitT/TauT family transport system substrate-binding protein